LIKLQLGDEGEEVPINDGNVVVVDGVGGADEDEGLEKLEHDDEGEDDVVAVGLNVVGCCKMRAGGSKLPLIATANPSSFSSSFLLTIGVASFLLRGGSLGFKLTVGKLIFRLACANAIICLFLRAGESRLSSPSIEGENNFSHSFSSIGWK